MFQKLAGLGTIVALTLSLPFLIEGARAQEPPKPPNPFGNGENPFAPKADEADENLGPLGIGATTAEGEPALTARAVFAGGPAEKAGLKPGEKLTGVDGKPFEPKASAVLAVAQACERAEAASKKDATVTLAVTRGGADVPVKVVFPSRGKHASTCPRKCEKCKKIVDAGVGFLLSKQKADGSFPTELGGKTGMVVVTSLSALALMAAGGADEAVSKAGDYVIAKVGAEDKDSPFGALGGGHGNMNQVNWELAYGLIFLDELARKTKRADAKAKIEEVARVLEKNREPSGGWGHGPGGPNPLGYVELEILGNYALVGLAGAKRNGYALDKAGLEKSLAWIESTTKGDGGVGYSPNEGQKGWGEAGRTSGAIAAFALLGQQKSPFFAKMAEFYRKNAKTLASGHVSPCMHLLTGALASYILGSQDWQEYVETYGTTIIANQKLDGSFASTPTHESKALHSNSDYKCGPCWSTATYVLILALGQERLGLVTEKAPAADPKAPVKTPTGGG